MTSHSERMTFSAAYSYVCEIRMANAAPYVFQSLMIPECLIRIVVEYIPPSALEFARYCFFDDVFSECVIIIPVESALPEGIIDTMKFLPVKICEFYDPRMFIPRLPWEQNTGFSPEQLTFIDAKVVPYFERVFARYARMAVASMNDLPSFYDFYGSLTTGWRIECRRIADLDLNFLGKS